MTPSEENKACFCELLPKLPLRARGLIRLRLNSFIVIFVLFLPAHLQRLMDGVNITRRDERRRKAFFSLTSLFSYYKFPVMLPWRCCWVWCAAPPLNISFCHLVLDAARVALSDPKLNFQTVSFYSYLKASSFGVCVLIYVSASALFIFFSISIGTNFIFCAWARVVLFYFFQNRIFSPGLASSNRQRRETLQSFQRYRTHSSSSDTTRPVAMELWVCRLILHFGAGVKPVYRTGSADEEREQKTSRSLNIWLHQKQQRKTMLT